MDTFFEELKVILEKEFPGAAVDYGEELGPRRQVIVEITWGEFSEMPESERQDRVWKAISGNFRFEEYRRVAFVITWTDSEKAAYAE
jgi:hypothetical protein